MRPGAALGVVAAHVSQVLVDRALVPLAEQRLATCPIQSFVTRHLCVNLVCGKAQVLVHRALLPLAEERLAACPIKYTDVFIRMNVKRFRGGLVLKAHRHVYHSTLGLGVIKKKRRYVHS